MQTRTSSSSRDLTTLMINFELVRSASERLSRVDADRIWRGSGRHGAVQPAARCAPAFSLGDSALASIASIKSVGHCGIGGPKTHILSEFSERTNDDFRMSGINILRYIPLRAPGSLRPIIRVHSVLQTRARVSYSHGHALLLRLGPLTALHTYTRDSHPHSSALLHPQPHAHSVHTH